MYDFLQLPNILDLDKCNVFKKWRKNCGLQKCWKVYLLAIYQNKAAATATPKMTSLVILSQNVLPQDYSGQFCVKKLQYLISIPSEFNEISILLKFNWC